MKVLERAAGHVAGPYRWQSLDIEATAVRTNNPICGAFRGFGANQAQFATEGVIDCSPNLQASTRGSFVART